MKNVFLWIRIYSLGIVFALVGVAAMGIDPFFGFFADREERAFPICQRDSFTYLGDDLEWKYSPTPVLSFDAICGYIGQSMGEFGFGRTSQERRAFENGRLIGLDTEIAGATFTVECVRYKNRPVYSHRHDWLLTDDGFYCKVPKLGNPLTEG